MKILYIHGMGGGEDSRIPSILKSRLFDKGVEVFVHTYDFDPHVATSQIKSWFDEIAPDLVIGESLGACHALCLRGVPHIFVSPAINAPSALYDYSLVANLTLFRSFAERFFRVTKPNRQELHFDPKLLEHYSTVTFDKVKNTSDPVFAFFGKHDKYRLSGIVSVRDWIKSFGPDSYALYDGTHYMEEEFIDSLLIPKILSFA